MEDFLDRVLSSVKKVSGVDTKILMSELYETEFDIYNHLGPASKPLSAVSMNDCEDFNTGSLLEEAMRTYIVKDIRNVYGLNLPEWLELPRDVIEMMIDVADEEAAKKLKVMQEAEDELANEQ